MDFYIPYIFTAKRYVYFMEILVTIFFIITIIIIGVFFNFFFKALLFVIDNLADFVLRLFFREEQDMQPAECALQKGRISIFHPSIKGFFRSYILWINLLLILVITLGYCSLINQLFTGDFDHYTGKRGVEYHGSYAIFMNTFLLIMLPIGLYKASRYIKKILFDLIEYDYVEKELSFERIKSLTETCTNNLLQRSNGRMEIENIDVKSDTYQELNINVRFVGFPKYGFMVHVIYEEGYVYFNVIGKEVDFLRKITNGIDRKFKFKDASSVKPKSKFCYYVRNNLMYNMKSSFEQDLPVNNFDAVQKEYVESKMQMY